MFRPLEKLSTSRFGSRGNVKRKCLLSISGRILQQNYGQSPKPMLTMTVWLIEHAGSKSARRYDDVLEHADLATSFIDLLPIV